MAYRMKCSQVECAQFVEQLELVEQRHKEHPSRELQQRLDEVKSNIAPLDAGLVAKDIMGAILR